jgi:hypothetical protein
VAGPLSAQDLPSNGCVVSSVRLDADFVYRLNGGQYAGLFTTFAASGEPSRSKAISLCLEAACKLTV